MPPANTNIPPRWECALVWAILLVFFGVELNCIHNFAFMGQDWPLHSGVAAALRITPDRWFYVDATSRPVIYWISNACLRFSNGQYAGELTAIICTLLNATALWVLYLCLVELIRSALLRVATLAFVAFLPVTLITSVVFAADSVVMLPFAVACWALMRSVATSSGRSTAIYAGIAGLALSAGQLCKFTFLLLPVAVVFVAVGLKRGGRINGRQTLLIIALAAVIPGAVGGWIDRECRREVAHEPVRRGFEWNGGRGAGRMTWSSLLGLKASDLRIFGAPNYWDATPDNPAWPVLVRNNNYSYLPLLHLCMFTDVLDFANQGSKDNGTPRPEPQRTYAKWAVRGGALFFIPMFAAVGLFGVRTVSGFFSPRHLPPGGLLIWGSFALCWFLPLILTLPFVIEPYLEGYFLPRLVIPAMWAFPLILFFYLDRILESKPRSAVILTLLVLIQSAIQIRSVWY